jgi:foldase protein PrsA
LLQAQTSAQAKAQLSQVTQQLSALNSALTSLPQVTLNQLINAQIVLQRARSEGVVATAKEINKTMTDLQHSLGGPIHFKQYVAQSGLSLAEIQNLQVSQLLQNKLTPVLAAKVASYQTEVRASHILLPATKLSLAKQLLKQVQHGANFAALAKKYSTDPGSKTKGGDLGYFPKAQMVAPFGNAAFAMKVGEIRLVKSQFGYHIIKVTGRKKIKLKATDLQTAKNNAFQNWLQQESSVLHVERLIAVTNLPNLATPVPTVPIAATAPAVVATVASTRTVPHPQPTKKP